MKATGIGSMPGEDPAAALSRSCNEVSLPFLPELPQRGAHTTMTGRAMGVVEGLSADISMGRWRVTDGTSLDQRRARSALGQDLDSLEELGAGASGAFKIQIAGPLTLSAELELPRGGRLLADHGALRELSESLAEGISMLVRDLQRRVNDVDLIVQIDEPGIVPVLTGTVSTISGYAQHAPIDVPRADTLLRVITEAISSAGAEPAVHCCSADIPVDVLTGAGFTAVSFDATKARPDDSWAQLLDAGIELWPGVVTAGSGGASVAQLRERLVAFFSALGFRLEEVHDQLVITPVCGLASCSPPEAYRALAMSQKLADALP